MYTNLGIEYVLLSENDFEECKKVSQNIYIFIIIFRDNKNDLCDIIYIFTTSIFYYIIYM